METDIEKLKADLKTKVSEKRYNHSIAVMNMCEKLGHIYNEDCDRLKLAGLMHDMAKDLSKEEKANYVKQNNIECTEVEKANIELTHGKIAADMCSKLYEFDDEMCTAIKFHTTGKENMTLFEKIVFIADKVDETRKYDIAEELREVAYTDLDRAIIANIDYNIKEKVDEGKLIAEESVKTRNYLLLHSEK